MTESWLAGTEPPPLKNTCFQATQTQEDKLEVMIVPGERYNDEIGEVLRQKVQEHTGDDMEVTFIPVDEIPPSETGKRALLRSLVNKP